MKLRHGEKKLTAQEIIDLLAVRHSSDVFVPECKDGPTQQSTHFRLDAWAMLKSWTNPTTFGYEVKVSRSDFIGDNKWQAYLPLCSDFYFVCQQGLILPDELPAEVGLIYATGNGGRLFTKKKAQRRHIEIPENMFRYILMCRARITREHYDRESPREAWKNWLAEKVEDRELGYMVSDGIRKTVEEKIKAVSRENERLTSTIQAYDRLREWLASLGISEGDSQHFYSIRNRMEKLKEALPSDLRSTLGNTIRSLQRLEDQIEEISNPKPVEAGVESEVA